MVKANTMKKITNETEWLEARQSGVGSSDSPVLALPPEEVFKKTALDVYISKKAPQKPEPDNVNFRRGHAYEPLAIVLAEQKLGMKIYAPKNEDERWNAFRVQDPDHEWIYADFDGLREDGWVIEVKSPMQRIADKIRTEGLKNYYMVQGQHLVHIASVGELPHLGKLPKGCPGVCFVIYEPETVSVQIYEIPRNDLMIEAILTNAENFWVNHIDKDEPPINPLRASMTFVTQKSEYQKVDGPAWDEVTKQYSLAKEQEASAKLKVEIAKNRVKEGLVAAGLVKVITGKGHKFSFAEQKGRTSLDKKALLAAHPNIDLSQFEKEGKPSKTFRHYGPKEAAKWGDETLDGQLLTLRDELNILGNRAKSMDMEVIVEIFDELRDRSEMYTRMLSLEMEGIESSLNKAQGAIIESTKQQEANDGKG